LGTAGIKGTEGKERKIVQTYLESGIRLIDTAQAKEWYDEESVGLAVSDFVSSSSVDNDIVIVTKIHPRSFDINKMRRALKQSKDLLQIQDATSKPLDIVLIHSPRCWQGHCTRQEESITWQTGWSNLEVFKAQGDILAIGVSNFGPAELEELLRMTNTEVSVVQN